MWSLLLSLSLFTLSPAPTLWQFDGQLAFQAQRWIQSQYGETLTDHLLDETALRAFLEREIRGENLQDSPMLQRCLLELISGTEQRTSDQSCNVDELLMRQLKLDKRVYLTADVEGANFYITLVLESLDAEPQVYTSTGSDLRAAGRAIIERAFGMGTFVLTGIPNEAEVIVDDILVGKGPGSYVVTAKEHSVVIKAKNYQDYVNSFTLSAGQKIEQNLTLVSSLASLKINIHHEEELEQLEVLIDGQKLSTEEFHSDYQLQPGKHRYKIDALDRQAIEREFELKPGEIGQLVVNLQYDRAPWKILLKKPHSDTKYGRTQIALRFQSQTLRSGAWSGDVSDFSGSNPPSQIRSQSQSLNGFGFDFSFDWLVEESFGWGPVRLNPLGYSLESFGDSELGEELKFDPNAHTLTKKNYRLNSLLRHKTRLFWLGYHLPMWRVSPYAQAGVLWVYERGEIERESTGETGIVSQHSLRLGWELGLDIRLSPEWVVKASMMSDLWPGERSAVQTLIGGAYAFDAFSSPLL